MPRRRALKLEQDPHNANRGTARGKQMLAESIEKYGAGRSIVVDRRGRILAGNKTAEAAEAAGIPTRVVKTTGDELVVVQRTDLDLDKDAAARELAYADNRIAEVDLQWDQEQLEASLRPAAAEDLEAFWTPAEQAGILGTPKPETKAKPAGTTRVPSEVVLQFDAAQAERWRTWMRDLERRYPDAETVAARIDAAIGDWAPPA